MAGAGTLRPVSRLPFKQPAGGGGAQPGSEPGVWSVTRLAAEIDSALRTITSPVRVVGEVSGFRDRTHWYFDLKDAGAVVSAVMFQSAARRSAFRPENGVQVVARGRLEFYAPGGKVSLLVERLDPVGAGAREQELKRLILELRGLGWLDPERKRPLPSFPRRIAVITSRTGAALQDVLATMHKRCPAVGVLVVDARVQGEGAAEEIAAAIARVGAEHELLGVDAVLVTRGGGSTEDLWAFNERIVARAIVECPIPVVAAIGHETDVTLAELVADERGATPTQAAMRLTPSAPDLVRELDAASRRLTAGVRRIISAGTQRTLAAERHPAMLDPRRSMVVAGRRLEECRRHLLHAGRLALSAQRARVVEAAGGLENVAPDVRLRWGVEKLAECSRRLDRALGASITSGKDRTAALSRQLRSVGPMRVLERGYSVTIGPDGRILRGPGEVRPGDVIRSVLAEGAIESVVEGSKRAPSTQPASVEAPPSGAAASSSSSTSPRRAKKGSAAGDSPGLFGA